MEEQKTGSWNPENGSSLILFVRRDTEIDKLCHNDCEQKALVPVIEVDEKHCHKQIIRTNLPPYHLCHR